VLQVYVSSVSVVSDVRCCKTRLECCICCGGCTRMLQASVLNVSSVFFSDVCCKLFVWMLYMFYTYVVNVFLSFQLFMTYVACVSSGCCKSRMRCCTCCEQTWDASAGRGGPHVRVGSEAGEGGPYGAAQASSETGQQPWVSGRGHPFKRPDASNTCITRMVIITNKFTLKF
jgi:hypothetical protein